MDAIDRIDMNTGNQLLISIRQDCNSVIQRVTSGLKYAGYQVTQSFNLHSALDDHSPCVCAHDSCSCQMAILLVYAQEGPPATLIVDCIESRTNVYLVRNPTNIQQPLWTGNLTQLLPTTLNR